MMVEILDSVRVNKRQQKLHVRSFMPQHSPTALLVWHHGYGEHILRYTHCESLACLLTHIAPAKAGKPYPCSSSKLPAVLTELANHGIAVFAQEAHGHGTSEPTDERNKCLVWDFNYLVQDASEFADEVLKSQPATPVFIGGQSLGGLISASVVLRNQSVWTGMVLCSAAIDVEWNLTLRLQAPLGGLLGRLVPRARLVPAVSPEDMSPDPKVVEDYVNDKLNFVGPVRSRTANEILKGFRAVGRRHSELALPILAVHGTSDHCTSLPAVKRLLQASQSKDKTLNQIPGGYHELIMGPEKEQVIAMVRDWILARSGRNTAKM